MTDTYLGDCVVDASVAAACSALLDRREALLGAFGAAAQHGKVGQEGYLLVTDRRILFWGQGSGPGACSSFHYEEVAGVSASRGLFSGEIVLNIGGARVRYRRIFKHELSFLVKTIQEMLGLRRSPAGRPL